MGDPPPAGSPEWLAQDKGPAILTISWLFTAASAFFVGARVYVQAKFRAQLRSDDWLCILGLICSFVATALSTLAVMHGDGKHMATLSPDQAQKTVMYTIAAFCPSVMSFGIPKLAVVALLTRLLCPSRCHRWFLWWLAIWGQLSLFATVGILLGQCVPTRALWDFSVTDKACFDKRVLIVFATYAGCFSAFVDIYLAVYPVVVLFKLQLSLKKKLALCVALGIGLVSGIVAIYKTTRIPSILSADFSYDTSDLTIWTAIEGSSILIACSIPCLQPLFEAIKRKNPFSSQRSQRCPNAARGRGAVAATVAATVAGTGTGKKPAQCVYEEYSLNSKSDIQLGQRRPEPRRRDDLGFTLMADEVVAGDAESQENILVKNSDEKRDGMVVTHHVTSGGFDEEHALDGAIMRTDHVRVSYDRRSRRDLPPDGDSGW